jgi:hypothetical protein
MAGLKQTLPGGGRKVKKLGMNKMLFLVLVILIFFTGCVNNTKIEYGNSDLKELLSIDTLVIELDSICLDVYEQGTAIFEDNNSIIFAGYNKHRHSIDWFDLSTQKIVNHTFLDRQGPNLSAPLFNAAT